VHAPPTQACACGASVADARNAGHPLPASRPDARRAYNPRVSTPTTTDATPRRRWRRIARWALFSVLGLFVLGILAAATAYWLIAPTLPSVATLRDVRMQVPLTVMSRDGKLIARFGEMRRMPVAIDEVPACVREAFLAAEDARFYEHPGVDWRGIFRAVWLLATGHDGRVPGGSTITQQVARNFFLSSEYKLKRKAAEILLALRIENQLTKDEIFELYLNKIFLGHRSYGIAAAADFYYGKTLDELTLPECAMLAALPKFPSTGNPITRPERALERRNYVLDRMLEVGFIDADAHRAAMAEPERAAPHESPAEIDAPYLAEMVRVEALERFGEAALTDGYVVHTTLDSRMQLAANQAVRDGILAYDVRHGWRGPEAQLDLADSDPALRWRLDPLAGRYNIAGLHPALVLEADAERALVEVRGGATQELTLDGMKWAREYRSPTSRGPEPTRVDAVLKPGDVVRIRLDEENETWVLAQLPAVQSALTSIDSRDGAIRAMVGGFSFAMNKFNRATQSARPPGSSFKPFVYSAAFEKGFNPGSLVNDAPVALPDPSQPDGWWRPRNDDGSFMGPMRLREAMVKSRNLVSVRLLDAIGARPGRDYMLKFGFAPESLPPNLSLALGTSAVAPLNMARGFATFVNGGKLVDVWFIERVEDRTGQVIHEAQPRIACDDCTIPAGAEAAPQAIDPRNAWLVHSLLKDVILRGTGSGARVLERADIGGKTGTTNDFRDVWFSGFGAHLVTTVWVGFDDFSSLGNGEFASRNAVPIWTNFMRVALDGEPVREWPLPDGLVRVGMNPYTGALAEGGDGAIAEYVRREDLDNIRFGQGVLGGTSPEEEEAYDIF
jgi:penicillin-binding protein 1A